jgi:hypothetical protein
MPSIYCVKTEPNENGELVYRNIDIEREVLYMGLTPKPSKGQKFSHPPGIPMFVTPDGTYLQLVSVESYQRSLKQYGFDTFYPSFLVNVALVDFIEVGMFGNDAYFKGCDVKVPISRPKTDEYRHLIQKRSPNPKLI